MILTVTQKIPISDIYDEDENPFAEARDALQNEELFGGDIAGIKSDGDDKNALPSDRTLWPEGIVPFEIDESVANITDLLLEAMDVYHRETCIRFVPRTDEYDYIKIVNSSGCFSYLGRQGGQQVVSIGRGCEYLGTVIHELMHAIGFTHEHQRSDRDDYIAIIMENVRKTQVSQFTKVKPWNNRIFTDYDFDSIMHYGPTAFSKARNLTTVVPKLPGYELKEPYDKPGFTERDIKKIQTLYQCI